MSFDFYSKCYGMIFTYQYPKTHNEVKQQLILLNIIKITLFDYKCIL